MFGKWLPLPVVFLLTSCNSDRIAALEKQNKELAAKIETLQGGAKQSTQSPTLDLQEKCAKQAEVVYKTSGLQKEQLTGYTNHYSGKLNKCFVQLSSLHSDSLKPTIYITVMDAYEGKVFADYYWINTQGKKYWEVKPFTCKVTMLNGEDRVCDSQDEFDSLVKQYMEE
jgi:hypothetical protein